MSWTAPADDGGSPITGYTVTPLHRRDRADGRPTSRRLGDERDRDRADQRRRPTRSGSRPTNGAGTAHVHGVAPASTPRRDAVRLRHAGTLDARRRQRDRARREVHEPTSAARSPACASTRRRPTPAPTSARCGPPAARSSARATFSGRVGLRLADAWTFATPVHDHGRHDLRRVLPRAERPLLGDRRGVRRGRSTTRRCTRWRTRRRQRRVRLQRPRRRSRTTPSTPPTTGWTSCSPPDPTN